MAVTMTVDLTQHFCNLAKTPEKYVADAQKFIDAVEQAGNTSMTSSQKIVGEHMLQDLENSAEHFVYVAATSHYNDDLHAHIEEKAEKVYQMADRLRSVLTRA